MMHVNVNLKLRQKVRLLQVKTFKNQDFGIILHVQTTSVINRTMFSANHIAAASLYPLQLLQVI